MVNDFNDKRAIGAFREAISAALTPVVQLKFPYNISTKRTHSDLVASGTVTQADSMAVVDSGAATSSSATLHSHDTVVYQPGQGVLVRFSAVFSEGADGSFQEIGVGDETDGYFIGMNGTQFSTNRRQGGVDNWTALTHVNDGSDSSRGRLDPTKGNVYQIQYQWLGFGQITYSYYDYTAETYIILHRENYPNNNTIPSTLNPSFPIRIHSENTTNDTSIVLKSASCGAYIEGRATKLIETFSTSNSKTITTEVSIMDLRNRGTFHGKTNRGLMFPKFLSVATDGTKSVTIRVYENATLGGTPSYSDVNTTESIVEVDTAGTTVTGGDEVLSFVVQKVGDKVLNLDRVLRIHNLDHVTITAESINSSIVAVSVSWEELL